MRVRGSVWASGLVLLTAVGGCGDASVRTLPEVSHGADGTEVARLGAIPARDAPTEWSFRVEEEIRTVVPTEQVPLIYDPAAVLLLSDDDLLVHDPTADQPLVIIDRASGTVRTRFGRKGNGPGELGGSLVLAESDRLITLYDYANQRIHRFELTGEPVSSVGLGFESTASRVMTFRGTESFLVESLVYRDSVWARELVETDFDGALVDGFSPLPPMPAGVEPGRIQRGRVLWAVVGDRVVAMSSGEPSLEVRDNEGELLRRIELPLSPRRLTERDIAEQVEEYGPVIRRMFAPGPVALTNLLYTVNDSVFGMFLSHVFRAEEESAPDPGVVLWRLLTLSGEYLGFVTVPEDFLYLGSSADGIWARVLDPQGLPLIQLLSIAGPSASSD